MAEHGVATISTSTAGAGVRTCAADLPCARHQSVFDAAMAPTQESDLRENCTSRLSERAEAGRKPTSPDSTAEKPANKAAHSAVEQSAVELAVAEPVEPRAGTKGNADQQSTCRAQSRVRVSQALDRIRKVAKERKKERFTALFHHISTDLLEEAFYELKENAAPGVDRLTWTAYEADLECELEDLHDRVQRGAYRALPSRRVYIPKPDGRQRPLAIVALEDKIVQRAVVALLNAIYEEDFLGISYGFRPGRGTHDALDALCVGIHSKKMSFILDAR